MATNRSLFYPSIEIPNIRALPLTLAKLKPKTIRMRIHKGEPVMQVQLFGVHRTGTYDEPYYGVWVVCTTNVSEKFLSPPDLWEHGMRSLVDRKGTAVFEVR